MSSRIKLFGRQFLLAGCCALLLAACDSGNEQSTNLPVQPQGIPPEQQRVIPTSESRAFREQGAYATVLKECNEVESEDLCTLGVLPYIGQTTSNPSVEDIMQRVIVTHDWMGNRFEQMLRRLPPDILTLFAPVTTVVIGSEVRPSSFNAARGRMRIDPWYFWLSVPEKRTVSNDADPRAEFGASLQFTATWRTMLGDNYPVPYATLNDDGERQVENLDIPLARLLYHELAHANDFVPPGKFTELNFEMTPLDAVYQLQDSWVSELLFNDDSLTNRESYLYGLANVRYFDAQATDFQNGVLADFAGAEMENGGKTVFYSYSTIREDTATLFDAAMMKFHYGADTHVAYFNKPDNYPDAGCNDYKVAWGVRNRLASPLVAPRAQYVVNQFLPTSPALDQFFANDLGQAVALRIGDGWCDSRFLVARDSKGPQSDNEWSMQRNSEYK